MMYREYDEEGYYDLVDQMESRITSAIRGGTDKDKFVKRLKCGLLDHVVQYSAYETDDRNDMPINNLDEIPHKGTFVVVSTMHWGENDYESLPVTDPTWLELAVLANESIHVTGDDHHVYFECVVRKDNTLELSFGS